jgi:hypothetical protein
MLAKASWIGVIFQVQGDRDQAPGGGQRDLQADEGIDAPDVKPVVVVGGAQEQPVGRGRERAHAEVEGVAQAVGRDRREVDAVDGGVQVEPQEQARVLAQLRIVAQSRAAVEGADVEHAVVVDHVPHVGVENVAEPRLEAADRINEPAARADARVPYHQVPGIIGVDADQLRRRAGAQGSGLDAIAASVQTAVENLHAQDLGVGPVLQVSSFLHHRHEGVRRLPLSVRLHDAIALAAIGDPCIEPAVEDGQVGDDHARRADDPEVIVAQLRMFRLEEDAAALDGAAGHVKAAVVADGIAEDAEREVPEGGAGVLRDGGEVDAVGGTQDARR